MTIVHLTTGLPAAGKTTHARSLGVLRFNLDDYRAMMGNGRETWSTEREQVAIDCMIESARRAILAGNDIVIDNCHLVPRLPRMYRKTFSSLGVAFQVHDFTHVSVDQCIANDKERPNGVGESVIRRMAASPKGSWHLTEKWMNVAEYVMPKPYLTRPNAQPAVIVDIDGTVAIHGDERGHYEYDKISTDRPNWCMIDVVRNIPEDWKTIFLSGREDRCKEETVDWLFKHGIYSGMLFMRATGDHRPDYIIKQELFDAHIRDEYNVRYVLDDRDQVVKMWREMGLTCLQVAPGDF
jgi:predicted kinase